MVYEQTFKALSATAYVIRTNIYDITSNNIYVENGLNEQFTMLPVSYYTVQINVYDNISIKLCCNGHIFSVLSGCFIQYTVSIEK